MTAKKTEQADQLIVIEHGRVVESGQPAELAARADGNFRRLMSAASVERA